MITVCGSRVGRSAALAGPWLGRAALLPVLGRLPWRLACGKWSLHCFHLALAWSYGLATGPYLLLVPYGIVWLYLRRPFAALLRGVWLPGCCLHGSPRCSRRRDSVCFSAAWRPPSLFFSSHSGVFVLHCFGSCGCSLHLGFGVGSLHVCFFPSCWWSSLVVHLSACVVTDGVLALGGSSLKARWRSSCMVVVLLAALAVPVLWVRSRYAAVLGGFTFQVRCFPARRPRLLRLW